MEVWPARISTRDPIHCHRHLLARILAHLGATNKGELET